MLFIFVEMTIPVDRRAINSDISTMNIDNTCLRDINEEHN